MVEVLDQISLTTGQSEVLLSKDSKTSQFLCRFYRGPWGTDLTDRDTPNKEYTRFGVWFKKKLPRLVFSL